MREKELINIISVGADIESIKRFENFPYESNQRFYNIIFNEEEIKACLVKSNPYQSFTARFVAKEAIIKGFSSLAQFSKEKLSFKDISILNRKNKSPYAIILKKKFHKINIMLSLSHTEEFAVGLVVLTN